MGKIAVAVYAKISGNAEREVRAAFKRAVLLKNSDYFENGVYGVVLDPPDSPCYKSCGDGNIVLAAERCLGSLPGKCRDKFFVTVRARRYNVNRGRGDAFSCEGGALGALRDLTEGGGGEIFSGGAAVSDAEYVYFSASGGVIEAGGINGLLKIALSEGRGVLPLIKAGKSAHRSEAADNGEVHIPKRMRGGCFSLAEGLYPCGTAVSPKSVAVCEKICVLEEMRACEPCRAETKTVKKKKNYPRSDYRAALSAARCFNALTENRCASVSSVTETVYKLTALTAMRMLGFLGEAELLKLSDELLCVAEEAICVKIPTESLGENVFLLTVLLGAYRVLAQTEPFFLGLGLRAGELKRFLLSKCKPLIGENDSFYLIMCCESAVLNVFTEYTVPRLMKAALSENACGEYRNVGGSELSDKTALCVLMSASNACCELNIRDFALSDPVFGAKLSLLNRAKNKSEAEKEPDLCSEMKDKVFDPTPVFGYNWLNPVKKRFFRSGVELAVLPYAAYIEELVRCAYVDNNAKSVKICYITANVSPLTRNLLNAAELFEKVFVCMVFESRYALELARREYRGRAELIFGSDAEICRRACGDAAFIRRLTPFTTLSELQAEIRGGAGITVNRELLSGLFSENEGGKNEIEARERGKGLS